MQSPRQAALSASQVASGQVWQSVATDGLRFAQWSVDTSVFDTETGETHLLGPLPVEALQCLCGRPRPFDALCAHLARCCDREDDKAWRKTILDMLLVLSRLELIEARPIDALPRVSGGT